MPFELDSEKNASESELPFAGGVRGRVENC
jgi:hypothetical protein